MRSALAESSAARGVVMSIAVLLVALLAAVFVVRGSVGSAPTPFQSVTSVNLVATTSTSQPTVVIAVGGAVRSPGVYRLPVGSRVVDALEAAGGPASDIDLDRINLAATVADGERVWLNRMGEATSPAVGGSPSGSPVTAGPNGPIDLNSATAAQLDGLPGVGPATAEAIISRRREVGRFRSVDDLLSVKGIGAAKLDALRSSVVVR